MKPAQPEWRIQELLWTFLQKCLPQHALCQSIDEAAKRTREANLRRHARGCLGGVGDVYVLCDGKTAWLECKAKTGTSGKQDVFRDRVIRNGGHYAKIKTLEDAEAALLTAGIPLRASLGDIRERIAEQNERLPPRRKRSARNTTAPLNAMSLAAYRKLNTRGIL